MFFKKKEKKCCSGCCSHDEKNHPTHEIKKPCILILGSGCSKCNELEENTKIAIKDLGINETITHITDYAEMASYGVMSTPALVVNGTVLSAGRAISSSEIKTMLEQHMM